MRSVVEVSISSEFQQFIERQVSLGAYTTPSEVVGDALRLLQLHDREREALFNDLRQKIAIGVEQLDRGDSRDRGDSIDAGEVFNELRRRNAQLQAKSR
jgi:antitoxin ParD1/3/4